MHPGKLDPVWAQSAGNQAQIPAAAAARAAKLIPNAVSMTLGHKRRRDIDCFPASASSSQPQTRTSRRGGAMFPTKLESPLCRAGGWMELILGANVAPLGVTVGQGWCLRRPPPFRRSEEAEVGGGQNVAARLDARLKVGHGLYCELLFIYLLSCLDGGEPDF